MKVQEYIREDGSNPYQKWFNSLNPKAAAKVSVAKVRLELGMYRMLNGLRVLVSTRLIGVPDTGSI